MRAQVEDQEQARFDNDVFLPEAQSKKLKNTITQVPGKASKQQLIKVGSKSTREYTSGRHKVGSKSTRDRSRRTKDSSKPKRSTSQRHEDGSKSTRGSTWLEERHNSRSERISKCTCGLSSCPGTPELKLPVLVSLDSFEIELGQKASIFWAHWQDWFNKIRNTSLTSLNQNRIRIMR